jgi:hypothetical protein
VPGTLRKPTRQAHRSSLYLNADEVSNSLAAFEGGDIEGVLTRMAEETAQRSGLSVELSRMRCPS